MKTPEENGCIESFYAGLDRDYLRHQAFDSFTEASSYIERAFVDYDLEAPMNRLG
ncbi:MAG: integrase core domain-containing protein [Thermoplasmatota archaeon]